MKILSVISKGYPVRGGAQTTNVAFLKVLSKQYGHDCRIYTNSLLKNVFYHDDIKITTFRDIDELQTMIQRLRPDIIMSTLEINNSVIRVAKKFNIPTVVRIGGFEYCPPAAREKRAWGFSMDKEYPTKKERDFVLREADAVVLASHYLKERLQKEYNVNFKMIYAEFIKDDLLVKKINPSQNDYITGSCGFAYKGVDIFYELAKIFKDEKFLLIGTMGHKHAKRFRGLKNVTTNDYAEPKNFLKMSKVVLVPSQCPESFGRIAVEAMANGVPVLASFTGGVKEIVKNSSLGVRNFHSVKTWEKRLRKLLLSKQIYKLSSQEGKTLSEKFLKGTSTKELNKLMGNLVCKKNPDFKAKQVVAICGETDKKTAYSSINFQWSRELKKDGSYLIFNPQNPNEFYERPLDYFIHHDYHRDFKKISAPDEGKFIAVRTWDFGRFPADWIEKIKRECDQLWVHSSWVRKQAIKSGIAAKIIKVIAHGVDSDIFKPGGKKYVVSTKKRFKFIFVGATIVRKGIDILLKAYGEVFSASDDVCLVIKDNSKDVFYSGISLKPKILKHIKDKKYPEIVYIDKYLSRKELASLYRACNVGVFPYRAEGFAIPIIEAMACGTPPIVPNFGACLDFCSRGSSFLMPAKRINVPVAGDFAINTLGFREKIYEIDFCEINVDVLAGFLKRAYNCSKKSLDHKSKKSVKTIHGHFTWKHTARKIKKELKSLDRSRTPLRLKTKRREYANNAEKYKIAQNLFLGSCDQNKNR